MCMISISGNEMGGMNQKKNFPKKENTIRLSNINGNWALEEVVSAIVCFLYFIRKNRIY